MNKHIFAFALIMSAAFMSLPTTEAIFPNTQIVQTAHAAGTQYKNWKVQSVGMGVFGEPRIVLVNANDDVVSLAVTWDQWTEAWNWVGSFCTATDMNSDGDTLDVPQGDNIVFGWTN